MIITRPSQINPFISTDSIMNIRSLISNENTYKATRCKEVAFDYSYDMLMNLNVLFISSFSLSQMASNGIHFCSDFKKKKKTSFNPDLYIWRSIYNDTFSMNVLDINFRKRRLSCLYNGQKPLKTIRSHRVAII